MLIRTLTPYDAPSLQAWYREAINDVTVMPFLSMNPCITHLDVKPDNWSWTLFMDNDNKGLAAITPIREAMCHRFNLCLWVLHSCTNRVWTAGRLFRVAEEAARGQGGKWLEWYVCEDNAHCLKFSRKHGTQFSAQPEAAWSHKDKRWKTNFGFTRQIKD